MKRPHFCSIKAIKDVRKYAAEQGIKEEEALAKGMAEKAKEFMEAGANVITFGGVRTMPIETRQIDEAQKLKVLALEEGHFGDLKVIEVKPARRC